MLSYFCPNSYLLSCILKQFQPVDGCRIHRRTHIMRRTPKPMSFTLAQQVTALAPITGLTHAQVKAVLTAQGDLYRERLLQGTNVRVPGIGTVTTRIAAPGMRHNPRTLERRHVPPRRKLKLLPSERLKWLPL